MKEKLKKMKMGLLLATCLTLSGCHRNTSEYEQEKIEEDFNEKEVINSNTIKITKNKKNKNTSQFKIEEQEIVISAVGDCTLGTDTHFNYQGSFPYVFEENNKDFGYFFDGVYDIVANDDVTIANLETTLTDASEDYRVDKKFNFKGDADYTNILTEGSIEVVNLANNHTYDYGEKGYNDTIQNLENAGIPYFGYENYSILDVDGIKIGLAGITGWNENTAKDNTDKAVEYFYENDTDLIIINYHWGIEREYKQNATQENIARYAIDQGADLILGHHPHVLQGIECYNGKYIVYSLGNFVFGGNHNPSDKDTMIFQETFHYKNGILVDTTIEIIPCSLSSRNDINDYQPNIMKGEEKKRVLRKIEENSTNLNYMK